MSINLDTYYRGLASQRLQRLADELLELSREAEGADAHAAAFHLADLSTQLLDMGIDAGGRRATPGTL
jgi:signal transduction histidine kinase